MTSGIKFEQVAVDFDGHLALTNLTLDLTAKTTAIIGANGSGKSTLARLINGLAKPTSGKVTVLGEKPNTKSVGFLFSNPDLQIVMPTVSEDVAFSLKGKKLTSDELAAKVRNAIDSVGLEELAQANCYTLSSGQKQLLALAGVMVREPKVLVADEPTTLLDLENTKRISKLLHAQNFEQLVIVTHDLELAATCEEAVWIERGKLCKVGASAEVISSYREFYS